MKTRLNAHRIWLALFGIWAFFLTGVVSGVLGFRSTPGILQAMRLQNLLHSNYAEMNNLQSQLTELQSEAHQFAKNPAVQRREIRKVLGYAAPDELIFDFNSNSSL